MRFRLITLLIILAAVLIPFATACDGEDHKEPATVKDDSGMPTIEVLGSDDSRRVVPPSTNLAAREPASIIIEKPDKEFTPSGLPPVTLKLERSEYPVVDGSTATIPLSVALARAVTGMSRLEAEGFVRHSKTTESFMGLAAGNTDMLLVYAPAESVFTTIELTFGLTKDDFVITPIGRDALVFLVNEQNPMESLTREQIIDIYTQKATKWSQLTGDTGAAQGADDDIIAFQRNEASGSQVMIENLLMKGTPMAKAPSERRPGEMGGLIEGIALYNNSGNAIGYSVYYYFKNMYSLEGVRTLNVDGVPCDDERIASGEYPLTQDFYAVIRRDEPEDSAGRKLYDLITGQDGARLIKAAGYTPSNPSDGGFLGSGQSVSGEDTDARLSEGGSPAGVLKEPAAARNVFPLETGGKTGFIDGSAKFVIEPRYDVVRSLSTYDGEVFYGGLTAEGEPIYYSCYVYSRNGDGLIDYTKYAYSEIIGPGGEIIYRSDDPYATYESINVKDHSIIGRIKDEKAFLEAGDVQGEYHEFFVFGAFDGSDGAVGGENGVSVTDFVNMSLSAEIYDGNRRVIDDFSNTDGSNGVYLTDLRGNKLTQEPFFNLRYFGGGRFIYQEDGYRPVVVNGDGAHAVTLPRDFRLLNNLPKNGMYAYTSADVDAIDVGDYVMPLYGLLDEGFGKITDPLWMSVDECTDKVFAAMLPKSGNDSPSRWILIDKSGNRLNDNYYQGVDVYRDRTAFKRATGEGGDRPDYILAELAAFDDGRIAGDSVNGKSQLLDEDGNVLFEDTDNQKLERVLADDYVVMRYDAGGFDETDQTYMEKYYTPNMGLKRIEATETLARADRGSWLIPPIYSRLDYDNFDGRFIIAEEEIGDSGRRSVVFDTETEKELFSGTFSALNFVGYPTVGGTRSFDQLLFYAETSMRRGYIGEDGEWIISVSVFD